MKKSATILTLIILLPLLSAIATPTTEAQDTPTIANGVTIWSPCNRTYSQNDVIAINASMACMLGGNVFYNGTAIIDGISYPLQMKSGQKHPWDPFFGWLSGTTTLPKLPEGQHNITVTLKTFVEVILGGPAMAGEATVYFTIADKTPPNIALNSICDVTYNQTNIPLNFVVNEPTTWIAYSLDNGTKTDIVSNTTLTVTTGVHSIVVYANDTAGNIGQSEVAHFAVQPWPQTGNIVVLTAIILAGMAAVVTLLVTLRTRKSGNRPAE